jgi:Active DUF488-N3 subclade
VRKGHDLLELYTSRYQNKELAQCPDLVKVGITVGKPRWLLGYPVVYLDVLAPWGLLQVFDKAEFTAPYHAQLDRAGVNRVLRDLQRISDAHAGQDLVLLCYEDVRKPDEWCHRQVLAEWLLERAGLAVAEMIDPAPVNGGRGSGGGGGPRRRKESRPSVSVER